jgi:hypothetical protein
MHPSSSRAFQRDQECDLKHPGSVDLTSTNKLPSFIDRWKKPCNFDSMICKIDPVMSFLIQTI